MMMVFFRTRLRKISSWQKFSETWESDFKVGISMKPNMVNSNGFWVELSAEHKKFNSNPEDICLFKVNSRNFRKSCEICSKLIIKTPEQHQWCFSGFSLTLILFLPFFYCFHCCLWTGKCLPEFFNIVSLEFVLILHKGDL